MATILDQQVALDEALVPSAVPEIYMQEFWATAKLHQHSIRFKMDTRKHVLDLEAFREMLHISPRIPGQSFAELPFEEEILEFLSKVDYAYLIWEDVVHQVEHKNQKKSNEMYYPRFTKVIIDYFMMRKPSIPRRNRVNWHYVRDDVLFSTIKLASARKKTRGSASSTTPPTPITTPTPTTTVVAAPRLFAAAKGKQPARATIPTEMTDVKRTEAEQLKIILKWSRQETHISQQRGSGTDEGTGSRPGVPDVPSDDSEEELSWNSFDDDDVDEQTKESDEGNDEATESDRESEDEETKEQEEESFDLIPRTPKDIEDDDNNEEDQGLRIGEEERMQEDEDAEELYRDVDINQGRGLQVSQETEDTHVIITPTQSDAQQESSPTSSFMTNLLNPITDPGLESLFTTGSTTVTPIPSPQSTMTPSIISTFTSASQLPTPPTQIPSLDLQSLPNFASVFRFEDRVKSLEDNFSNIPGIVNQYMNQQMPEAVREAMQTQT
nr:hypothetical protein [Tanacetum cinerariifolium]